MSEITLYKCLQDSIQVSNPRSAEELKSIDFSSGIFWINIEGLDDRELLNSICEQFALHPLILEDLSQISEQPKSEIYDDSIFIVLRMLSLSSPQGGINTEHMSILLGREYVITFQEGIEGDVFSPVRERLNKNRGSVKKYTADYICYLLLHAVINSYSEIIELTSEQVEELEELILEKPLKDAIVRLHEFRNDLLLVRKSIAPLRDILIRLGDDATELIRKENASYFRYLYSHSIHETEMIESAREMVMGLQDLYLSSVSTRMNEVMKVLTIITTIFIPLSFIAGLYGMNFKFMPELEWPFGYYLILLVMFTIAAVMVIVFRKKKWF